ncbi:unnamed protein product [Closterium sp. NIES-65]|nr:unnamed protein product [Closterium sp. NIES-65]
MIQQVASPVYSSFWCLLPSMAKGDPFPSRKDPPHGAHSPFTLLAFAASCAAFTGLQDVFLAAWLQQLLTLRFFSAARVGDRPWRDVVALTVVVIATQACGTTVAYGNYALSLAANVLASCHVALANVLPCLADSLFRFTYRRSPHLHPLVFPLVSASIWSFLSLLSPFGALAHPFYSLCSLLPLVQATSFVGMDGVLLLVDWLVAGIHQMMCEGDAAGMGEEGWSRGRRGGGIGGEVGEEGGGRGEEHMRCPGEGEREKGSSQVFGEACNGVSAQTQQRASAGDALILWSETPIILLYDHEEDKLLADLSAIAIAARANRTAAAAGDAAAPPVLGPYLGVSYIKLITFVPETFINTFVLIDPSGASILRYNKSHLFPSVEADVLPGSGSLPVVDTELGRMSVAVCLDMQFPALIRQAGRQGCVKPCLGRASFWDALNAPAPPAPCPSALPLHWPTHLPPPLLPHPPCIIFCHLPHPFEIPSRHPTLLVAASPSLLDWAAGGGEE